jgi:hypothetical protein
MMTNQDIELTALQFAMTFFEKDGSTNVFKEQ